MEVDNVLKFLKKQIQGKPNNEVFLILFISI
jgi:hypothetical protein